MRCVGMKLTTLAIAAERHLAALIVLGLPEDRDMMRSADRSGACPGPHMCPAHARILPCRCTISSRCVFVTRITNSLITAALFQFRHKLGTV